MTTGTYNFFQANINKKKYAKMTLCFDRELSKKEVAFLDKARCVLTLKSEFDEWGDKQC